MLKIYNYILTIMLYPFLLLLEYLMLTKFITGSFYLYIIIFMIILFVPSFIMTLYGVTEEILSSKSKWRLFLLIFFSIFYLPIYYTKYVSKKEKYLGYIICLINISLSILTLTAFNNQLYKYLSTIYQDAIIINEDYVYTTSNNLFSVNVSKDFRCKNNDIGDYVISCDRLDDDSFIGIYSYDVTDYSDKELLDILSFHLDQTKEYIKESGYDATINYIDEIIEIDYRDMVVLLTQINYRFDNNSYSLIISKEMPKAKEDILEFKKMIETVHFLNYN